MDKILTYENREMSMARIRSSITLIILRKNSNIFTCQLIFKSKFYIREERFRDVFLRTKCILLGIAQMSGGGGTLGQHWLLKQFSLNHPVEHIQKPKLPKLYVRVETSTSYFIIHNQFVK